MKKLKIVQIMKAGKNKKWETAQEEKQLSRQGKVAQQESAWFRWWGRGKVKKQLGYKIAHKL